MEKQIIINYNEYLEMEQKIKDLIEILIKIRFKEDISDEIKKDIDEINRLYGFYL